MIPSPFRWVARATTGDSVPPCIGGYSLTALPSSSSSSSPTSSSSSSSLVVLFGGCDAFGVAQNALYVLDTDQWRWSCLQVTDTVGVGPCQRLSHSATMVLTTTTSTTTELLVYGGMRAVPEEEVFGDLWRLRLATTTTTRSSSASSKKHPGPLITISWEAVQATGSVPCARHSHAAVALPDGGLLILGGSSAAQQPLGDLFLFHNSTSVWRQLDATILPREMASAVMRFPPPSPMGLVPTAVEVVVVGGRTTGGTLLADGVVLDLRMTDDCGPTRLQGMSLSNAFVGGRCNHQMVLLGGCSSELEEEEEEKEQSRGGALPSVLLTVGGLDARLQMGLTTAESDALVAFPTTIGAGGGAQAAVGLMERTDGVTFGFGHALCSWDQPWSSSSGGAGRCQRVLVGSGIVPNKVGGSLDVFELCTRKQT